MLTHNPMNYKYILLVLYLLPLTVQASDTIETVAVIGSRSGLPPEQLSGQVSVIDQARIEALNKTSIQDLIQGFAGVSINQQGGAGGISSFYVRGGEANFTVIMIDGVQVNNPVDTRGGSFDFSTLDPSQVSRLELIRGPQSAIYGADALSGVLNIVTADKGGEGEVVLRAELGSDEYYRGTVSANGGFGSGGAYSFGLGRSDSGDVVEGSDRQLNFFNAGVSYDLTELSSLQASLRYSDSDRSSYPEDSGGPEYALSDELDQGDAQDYSLQLDWRSQISDSWRYQLTASWFHLDSDEQSPGIFPGFEVPPTGSDVDFDRYQLGWVNRFDFEHLRLSIGANAEREEGSSEGYIDYGVHIPADFDLQRDSYGAFAELHYDLNERVLVSASLRFDDVDDADSEVTSRLGLLLRLPGDATELRANWGEGFKPASFFALAHPLVGNPDLQAETADGWDLGVRQQIGGWLNLNLSYFDISYKDLIDFDDELFINVNRDQVESKGVELSFEAGLGAFGELLGHATYLDMDIVDSGDELRGRPQWKAGLQWLYSLGQRIELSADYLWVDEVVESSRHTLQATDYTLDAYNTLDLALNWRLNDKLLLQASVTNVLDENYEQAVGFPAAGIFPRLGVEVRL
jgi:vitamin B12 transporter